MTSNELDDIIKKISVNDMFVVSNYYECRTENFFRLQSPILIGDQYNNCNYNLISIPASVTRICNNTLCNNYDLEELIIWGPAIVEKKVLLNCPRLKTLVITKQLKSIELNDVKNIKNFIILDGDRKKILVYDNKDISTIIKNENGFFVKFKEGSNEKNQNISKEIQKSAFEK